MNHANFDGEEDRLLDQGADRIPPGTWTMHQPEDHAAGHSSQSESSWRGPCLLSRLPDEIILKIVELVRWDCKLAGYPSEFEAERWERMGQVFDSAEDGSPCSLPQEAPILNPFQSLAAVNHRLHEICRPLLWNAITFPTSLPSPMHTWTDLILRRHGHLVESLCILSPYFAKRRSQVQSNPAHDNTIVWGPDAKSELSRSETGWISRCIQELSCDSIAHIVSQCPRLHSLALSGGWESAKGHRTDQENFLVSLIARLSGLRKLKLSLSKDVLSSEGMRQIIQALPLLTSLTLCRIGLEDESDESRHLLGCAVGQLKYLSCLSLECVNSVSPIWRLCPWSQTITHLTVSKCRELLPGFIPDLISLMAPRVTNLDITIPLPKPNLPLGTIFHWPKDNRSYLPHLTHLTLDAPKRQSILPSFVPCKNLVYLRYAQIYHVEWGSIQDQIVSSGWFRLSSVGLSVDHYAGHPMTGLNMSDEPFRQFCQEHGIQLVCTR